MPKRSTSFISLLIILAIGFVVAFEASQLVQYQKVFSGSYTYNLLFTSFNWLIPVAVFAGIFAGAASKHEESKLDNGKVLRHDGVAFLVHWAHASSTLLLLVTGVYLGFLFIPRLISGVQNVGFMLNLHFVGVVIFLFSITYHLTDLYISGTLAEHMPASGDLKAAFAHYAAKLGMGKAPKEGKYLASEKLSYPLWVVSVGLVILSGFVKVSAHVWNLPAGLMGVTTLLHDVGALLVAVNLAAHVFLSSIVPWSWPLLKSMITGYVSAEYAQKHHALWYAELSGEPVPQEAEAAKSGPEIPVQS